MKARNYWHYPWLPRRVITAYRAALPRLEGVPVQRRFGVSTLIIARRPSGPADQGWLADYGRRRARRLPSELNTDWGCDGGITGTIECDA
jgi:hypothetical protein